MYLLEGRGLSKHFGGIRAIEDVSFRIQERSIVSIIGPNGAGKTTLFNCLTGITRLTKGVAYLSDRKITGLPPYEIVRLGMARTFQNIRLFKEMSVLDNVLVSQHLKIKTGLIDAVMRNRGFLSEERTAREKALEYLDLVGLRDLGPVPSFSLPYGEQRRLEIARALATDPAVLLLDEPTAGMNPQETSEIMKIIMRLQKMGKTIILIEHDMKVVMGISETVIVLDHGVKIAEGPPEMIKNEPMVIKAYLGR
ncbi:MAG TPA: ABC transporter ATP-binding protein [Nitrospiraceae bacterium]|jgi:branched-chain amino acid transport system ATP-binding protein|nr:ABC transporter ATP-binding protein [Nitrospiraceae bacterium]